MKTLYFVLLAILFSSCASKGVRRFEKLAQHNGQKTVKIEVPFKKQFKNECGPNSLAQVLNYYNKRPQYEEIKVKIFSKKSEGTHSGNMVSGARRLGLAAYKVSINNLITALEEAMPVITFHNLGLSFKPIWHYNVLVGFNSEKKSLIVHDGIKANNAQSYKRFIQSWERGNSWAYVFVPPERLPSFARFSEAINNALIFEKTGNYHGAFNIYETAKIKWPKKKEVYLGQANILYKINKKNEAIAILKQAVKGNIISAEIFYNLSLLYKELKFFKKSIEAKEKALSLALKTENRLVTERIINPSN